jgi:pimeloyl-ACP methyl ester carboxylesterase
MHQEVARNLIERPALFSLSGRPLVRFEEQIMKSSSTGRGRPLLLVHGLGNTRRAWDPIIDELSTKRRVHCFELPGHGSIVAERDSGTFAGLARSLVAFLEDEGLMGCDMVGSSLGAQLVLEMARLGKSGAVVALDPGGFWRGWERVELRNTLTASLWSLRTMKAALPGLMANPLFRSLLLGPLSARPWALDAELMAFEFTAFAETETLQSLIEDLAFGPPQAGPSAAESGPITIGWGRHDRLLRPVQALRALAAFPEARLHWFEQSGHFPAWDEPEAAAELILEATGPGRSKPRRTRAKAVARSAR